MIVLWAIDITFAFYMVFYKNKAYLALIVTSIVWGTTWIAMKFALKGIPPFQLAATRHIISGLIYVAFFLFYKKEKLPTKEQFVKLIVLGTISFVGANGISTWSLKYIGSGLGALIGALYPLSVVLIEYFYFNNKKINSTTIFGIAIGIIGICVVFYENAFQNKSSNYLLGILLAIIAMLCWSVASVMIGRKYVKMNSYYSTGWQMLISFISCSLISFLFEKQVLLTQIPSSSIWGIVYLIVFGSFLAMICFVYTMQHLKPAIASLYAYINPIVAMLCGTYFLNESLTLNIVIGSVITIVGVYLVNKSFKKQAIEEEEINPALEG